MTRYAPQHFTEHDHPFLAAGRLWTVPSITLSRMPDGAVSIGIPEIRRIHRAIANAICAQPDSLSPDELEFLCDVTDTSVSELADSLGVAKSTVSRWRSGSRSIPPPVRGLLQRSFWLRIFADDVEAWRLPSSWIQTDARFLALATRKAIDSQITFEISPRNDAEKLAAGG